MSTRLGIEGLEVYINDGYVLNKIPYTTKEKAALGLPTDSRVVIRDKVLNLITITQDGTRWIWYEIEGVWILIDPVTLFVVQQESSMYALYDGNNDSIEFVNTNNDYLDWSKSWALGITLLIEPQPADQKYLTIFQNGQNRIIFNRGGANMGVYVSYTQAGYANGANTWYEFSYGDKLLFNYDHTTRVMNIRVSNPPSHALNGWNITLPTAIAAGEPNGTLSIGKPQVDVPNAWGASKHVYYHGGVNNFIAQTSIIGDIAVNEYFTLSSDVYFDEHGNPIVAGDYIESQNFYGDLTTYCAIGEDVFPTVVDKKALLTGGEMKGGGQFLPIPSE